jgi:hypothetical protein
VRSSLRSASLATRARLDDDIHAFASDLGA